MATKATTSMHKSSATRRALLYKRRRSPARCAGTGTATSKATTGSENLSVGLECLAESTPLQRTGLIESVFAGEWGEAACGADTQGHQGRDEGTYAVAAGNLLSALRG
jgi:hypothetical protein